MYSDETFFYLIDYGHARAKRPTRSHHHVLLLQRDQQLQHQTPPRCPSAHVRGAPSRARASQSTPAALASRSVQHQQTFCGGASRRPPLAYVRSRSHPSQRRRDRNSADHQRRRTRIRSSAGRIATPVMAIPPRRVRRHRKRLQRIKAAVVMSEWQTPRELPDLRRVETSSHRHRDNDKGLRAESRLGVAVGRWLCLRHLPRLA